MNTTKLGNGMRAVGPSQRAALSRILPIAEPLKLSAYEKLQTESGRGK